ncbi:MAG TPA: ATP-binding cassette domain-containing protein [Cytophagales bacterium]|jgi:ABC-type nitrate/sulfonate/bicarbonate transport system ATPase subunit
MHHAYQQNGPVLRVENLSVARDGKEILRGISFTEHNVTRPGCNQGQVVAFVGRSGRGKSTLFRAIAGLEKPAAGRVLIPDYARAAANGQQPAREVAEGDVGFVSQQCALFRHKTVYQALRFALRKADLSAGEKEEKVMQYLRDWGLEGHKHQFPHQLSGGQRQRTAILEQLLGSGYYLVLDEPFSGLDVGNVENVKCAFRLIDRSHDLNTLLFSTHDVDLAVELADSVYVLGCPHPAACGPAQPATLLRHFDLKAMGLAWHDGLTGEHARCAREIKALVLGS